MRVLGIETLVPGPDGAHLQLQANGVVLWNGERYWGPDEEPDKGP